MINRHDSTKADTIAAAHDVVIYVSGGVVQDWSAPDGITVAVIDWDDCAECTGDECPDYCPDQTEEERPEGWSEADELAHLDRMQSKADEYNPIR